MFDLLSSISTNLFDSQAPAVTPPAFGAPATTQTATTSLGATAPASLRDAVALFGGLFGDDNDSADTEAARQAQLSLDASREELAKRLVVGEPGATGPNAVSEDEFQRLVQMYDDIKNGHSDIMFLTEGMDPEKAAEMKNGAMNDIASMLQTESGRALVGRLSNNEDEHGNHMATAIRFIDDNHHAHCTRMRHDDMDEEWAADARDHNGVGNVAFIDYAPGQSFQQTGPGMDVLQRGDTTLFHEMVHALHRTNGTLAPGAATVVDPLDNGIDADEYQATGLGEFAGDLITENHYRAERMALGDPGMGIRPRYSPDGRQAH